jgi:Zn-dependent peptidase ImmA (M78 family)
MSKYITSFNLDEVINENKKIKSEIDNLRSHFFINHNKVGILGADKLAFETLKKNHTFLQIPIPDEYYGGTIIVRGKFKISLINSGRPRVYQYFVAWHEIYHLLYDTSLTKDEHVIQAEEMEVNERKADYFASKMLLGDVYKYYYSLEDDEFINKIARCVDIFKAPYKAILIELYEAAVNIYNDLNLKKLIKDNFDNKTINSIEIFEKLDLDTDLLKPSNIISFGDLDKRIELLSKEENDVDYHNDNIKFLKQLRDNIKKELTYGED